MATRRTPAESGNEPRRLTDTELTELMRLVKGADSVELKVTVPADAHRATIQGLGIDPVEAQPRQAYFFDTPDLALNDAGLVVRARRIQGGRGDTVVKLRPVEPAQLSPELRKDPSFNVEVDALPGGFVCSASFKGRTTGDEVRDAVRGKMPLRRLFSKGQRAFFAARAPEGIELDSLVPLGPTFILKTRLPIQLGLGKTATVRQLVAEMWLYPDGSRILELSTKCLPAETFQVAAETRGYLAERGIDLSGIQQTKTRTALEFHAKHLPAAPAASAKRLPAGGKAAAKAPAKDATNGAAAPTEPATT
jgi:hypothetical protein